LASTLGHRRVSTEGKPNDTIALWAAEQEEDLHTTAMDASAALENKYPYIVSNVVYQANTPWGNTVWIDVGRESEGLAFPIQKNCPVVVQDMLIGIVDYVGAKASLVRLISDPSIRPAVRVVRGKSQTRDLIRASMRIQKALAANPSLLPKPELSSALTKLLDCLLQSLPMEGEIKLAKGELQGAEYASTPSILRGVGFNYDFSDEEGPARDLRTGQRTIDDQKILLIKPGDLLETSGFDGIFPRGLRVATVASVFPLEEGAISYQILAHVESEEFPTFDQVTIIPAQPQGPLQPPTATEFIKDLVEDHAS
jgi:hypothetical protein